MILTLTQTVSAQLEKNEVYLFTCPIADAPVFQQIAVKYVSVLEQGAQFQYLVMDVEAGNDTDNVHGEGYHMKYLKNLFTSQNADTDLFVQNSRTNYMMQIEYSGPASNSELRIDFDLLNSGAFVIDINGYGPLFNLFRAEFGEAMLDSNLYSRFEMPECFSHPNLRNFLD
jgi:hypothetical protein